MDRMVAVRAWKLGKDGVSLQKKKKRERERKIQTTIHEIDK